MKLLKREIEREERERRERREREEREREFQPSGHSQAKLFVFNLTICTTYHI